MNKVLEHVLAEAVTDPTFHAMWKLRQLGRCDDEDMVIAIMKALKDELK